MSWNLNVAHQLHVYTVGDDLGKENVNNMKRKANIYIFFCFPFQTLIKNQQFLPTNFVHLLVKTEHVRSILITKKRLAPSFLITVIIISLSPV
jgi:hypothetical protein